MTIKFFIRGKNEYQYVQVRIRNGRKFDYTKKTTIEVGINYWNPKTERVSNGGDKSNHVKLNKLLDKFQSEIREKHSQDENNSIYIDKYWLQNFILDFNGQKSNSSEGRIYFDSYEELWETENVAIPRLNEKTGVPASPSTMKNFKNAFNYVREFDKFRKRRTKIYDINIRWKNDFSDYMLNYKSYAYGTVNLPFNNIKTLLNEAEIDFNITIHKDTQNKRKFVIAKDAAPTMNLPILTEDDIFDLLDLKLPKTLSITRDWMIIGANIGLRVETLLTQLKIEDFRYVEKDKIYVKVENTQKTGTTVTLPVFEPTRQVLMRNEKNDTWALPNKISSTTFNANIKLVLKKLGRNELILNKKRVPTGKILKNGQREMRMAMVQDNFYSFITAHSLRRSCATMLYTHGTPIKIIAACVGWATLDSVETYIQDKDLELINPLRKIQQSAKMRAAADKFNRENNVTFKADMKIAN